MSLLLPQTRTGTVVTVQPVDIHGDRYVDLRVALDGAAPDAAPHLGRISAAECAANLVPGERVGIRFVMGVMTRVAREGPAPGGAP